MSAAADGTRLALAAFAERGGRPTLPGPRTFFVVVVLGPVVCFWYVVLGAGVAVGIEFMLPAPDMAEAVGPEGTGVERTDDDKVAGMDVPLMEAVEVATVGLEEGRDAVFLAYLPACTKLL